MRFVNYSEKGKFLILTKSPYAKINSCQATVATALTPALIFFIFFPFPNTYLWKLGAPILKIKNQVTTDWLITLQSVLWLESEISKGGPGLKNSCCWGPFASYKYSYEFTCLICFYSKVKEICSENRQNSQQLEMLHLISIAKCIF